ncbi:ABC transporter permease [Puerhibacterium puerhi]|uniref:ABC transporter permease n=1 Tax=Puerhibacterium puerhi TaxID=2692623 RepID=UPI001F1E1DF1|nr:ABC transporter permease [Puerhibacterium puerhi]
MRTVAQLELRQRLRSTRWKVALVVWFVVVGAITALAVGALGDVGDGLGLGSSIFGIVVFFVLFLGLIVAPTLSSAAVNGDRNAGTLATLQATLLTPAEIVVGKLLAAWAAALAFLVASVPFIVWAILAGGLNPLLLLATLAVLALELGVVCAIGLGFSALVTKTSGSGVLTYLVAGALSVGTLLVFGLTVPAITAEEQVRAWDVEQGYDWESDEPPVCEWQTVETTQVHTERTWWLLAANPFVVVADVQPVPPYDIDDPAATSADPLALIQTGVRAARTGPADEVDWCTGMHVSFDADGQASAPASPVETPELSTAPVWPWGLGLHLLLGLGAVAVAVRRLRIPAYSLPRGTRVA